MTATTAITITEILASVPTAEAARERFQDAGLFGPALEWAVRTGAQKRHMARTAAVREVALVEAKRLLPEATDLQVQVLALVLIWAEIAAAAEAGTMRLSWARVLGKGRREASDGPAWTAAVEAAGVGLAERLRCRGIATVKVAPAGEERLAISTEMAGSEEPVPQFEAWLPPPRTKDFTVQLARWALEETVMGASHRLLSEPAWLPVRVELVGEARDWASVWNWVETAAPYEVGVAWASRQNKAGRDVGSGDDPVGEAAARAAGAAIGYKDSELETFVRGSVAQYQAECAK